MNPEIKKEWLDLLRSGEIKQGQFRLRSPDGKMCCLGVLCELHRRKTNGGKWEEIEGEEMESEEMEGGVLYVASDTSKCGAYLPSDVSTWAGLEGENSHNPVVPKESGKVRLSYINDTNDDQFRSASDAIEKYL